VPAEDHEVHPYLLRDLVIDRPNQVWCADITYIPMRRGFLYLVAIMDWASRKVLAWRLSNTMDTEFCIEALEEALGKYGRPEIFNTDQGSQFTSPRFTRILKEADVRISMDGNGRWMDNVFIERLWRSLKYECVYLQAFETGTEARKGIGDWIGFYCVATGGLTTMEPSLTPAAGCPTVGGHLTALSRRTSRITSPSALARTSSLVVVEVTLTPYFNSKSSRTVPDLAFLTAAHQSSQIVGSAVFPSDSKDILPRSAPNSPHCVNRNLCSKKANIAAYASCFDSWFISSYVWKGSGRLVEPAVLDGAITRRDPHLSAI
jgi:transposase InsO family protein